jgi:transposase
MPAGGVSVVWLSNDLLVVGDLSGVWLERGSCMNVRNQECPPPVLRHEGGTPLNVMIGVDPHKGSHTAVAIDGAEAELARLQVPARADQVVKLLAWAAPFRSRTWAVESAGGLGLLLSEQLVAAGEHVVDVPATLAARVRVLGTGRANKNDPNDARSVAIAALRAPGLAALQRDTLVGVLRVLAKRNGDLGRARNRTACRLHAVLAELAPGGISSEISVSGAVGLLAEHSGTGPVEAARHQIACELVEDLRRFDDQMRQSRRRITDAVATSATSLTDVFGVGPIVACMLIGYSGDIARFASRDHYAAYNGTAPIEMSSGRRVVHRLSRRGNRQLNHALHIAAIVQIRHRHSPGRAFYERKLAEGKTKKEAVRALKRRLSDVVYRHLVADAQRR